MTLIIPIACRLGREETAELFTKRSVEHWGELIQLGQFPTEKSLSLIEAEMEPEETEFLLEEGVWFTSESNFISFEEAILEPQLNKNFRPGAPSFRHCLSFRS